MANVLCVSTTSPSTALSSSGFGGTMTIIDPTTGACLSSLRVAAEMSGKSSLGISSASSYPSIFSKMTNNCRLALVYGKNKAKKDDTYAMLLSIRSGSAPPILHWKCRLPEADLTGGLSISPCGHYVAGGGGSGNCFVWSSIGGSLLRVFKAHYRSVKCMEWSDCGRYLATGGADGMVHLFSLMELVDQPSRTSKKSVTPLHTWSFHHFPVTCLTKMDGGRMASGAEDGHIVIMELFSKTTVATIKVPDGVTCITHHNNRIFVGSIGGTIYSIDLDAYAMHETEKQGASLSVAERKRREEFLTAQERIFGKLKEDESETTRLFRSEWIGHQRSVSSIAFLVNENEERLISGDQRGQIRIWDVRSRTCLKVLHPWSNATTGAATSDGNPLKKEGGSKSTDSGGDHPIASIMVMAQLPDTQGGSGGMFGSSSVSHQRGQTGVTSLFPPLQKFVQDQQARDDQNGNILQVPFLKPNLDESSFSFWRARTLQRKRKRMDGTLVNGAVDVRGGNGTEAPALAGSNRDLEEARQRIQALERELATKKEEVERWEKVNNKLMAKLKAK